MTNTEDDLLAAILAEPADDTPRYALADLWEERGDPRGEFVRMQLRLAELLPSGQAAHAADACCGCHLCALRLRQADLSDALRDRLMPSFPMQFEFTEERATTLAVSAGSRAVEFGWRRGFVGQVACSAWYWLNAGEQIVRMAPIEEVVLTTPPPVSSERNERDRTVHFWLAGVPTMHDYIVAELSLRELRSNLAADLSERIVRACLKNWLPGNGKNGIRYSLTREAALHAFSGWKSR